jgi:hypothetical protein
MKTSSPTPVAMPTELLRLKTLGNRIITVPKSEQGTQLNSGSKQTEVTEPRVFIDVCASKLPLPQC